MISLVLFVRVNAGPIRHSLGGGETFQEGAVPQLRPEA